MHKLFQLGAGLLLLFAADPASSNYTLKSYDIGSGGTNSSSSSSYTLNGTAGSQSGTTQSSASYSAGTGVNQTQNANVPPAPSFTNPNQYYDRLKLVVNTGNNATDAKYLIAISSDNFVTTNYVQTDNSVSSNQTLANYQTYTAWGGASGFLIVGLTPSTSYSVKLKAIQGNFSASAFGPLATAATAGPTLLFSLATTLNSTPPFPVNFASLTPGTVTSGDADALITLTTNANNGGSVYVKDTNTGLSSTLASSTIASATTDLSSAASGYGAQVISATTGSGGPFVSQSPFNGTLNNVGGLTTGLQSIFTTSSAVSSGNGTVRLKAKVSSISPSANDYSDAITFVAAMNY